MGLALHSTYRDRLLLSDSTINKPHMKNNSHCFAKFSFHFLALTAILTSVCALSGCSNSNENSVTNVAVDASTAATVSAKGAADSAASEQARARAAEKGSAAVAQQRAKTGQ